MARWADILAGSTCVMKTTVRPGLGSAGCARLSPVRVGVAAPVPHAATTIAANKRIGPQRIILIVSALHTELFSTAELGELRLLVCSMIARIPVLCIEP